MRKITPFTILLLSFCLPLLSFPQTSDRTTIDSYIRKYRIIAINEMNLHRIPASITLAQGLLETDNGNSELAQKANNHFGIKCKNDWSGPTYVKDDDDKNECFRKYENPYESYADHSAFLTTRERYRFLFDLDITDYKGWAHGLKSAGYATNPEYANKLIKLIEVNHLNDMDDLYVPGKILVIYGSEISYDTSLLMQPIMVDSIRSESFFATYRRIYKNNDVKFIFAMKEDSFYKIARDFNIYTYQIPKYNELPRMGQPAAGQVIYLEKKKKKSAFDYHIVAAHQTIHSISQIYAIRTKSLLKLNKMAKREKVMEGQVLRLNPRAELPWH